MSNNPLRQKPNTFKASSVDLINADGDSINIYPLIDAMSITESIFSMFAIYEFYVLDGVALLESMGVTGSEKIKLEITTSDGSEETTVTKELAVIKFRNYERQNEVAGYEIQAIPEEALLSSIDRVNRTVTGTINQIIKDIYGEIQHKLPVEAINDSMEGNYNISLPNLTYAETISLLLSKGTNSNGSNFHLYETLWGNKIFFNTYDNMIGESPVGEYILNRNENLNATSSSTKELYEEKKKKIQSIRSQLGLSHFDSFKSGAYKSKLRIVDLAIKKYEEVEFDVLTESLPMMEADRTINNDFTIGPKSYDDLKQPIVYDIVKNSMAYEKNLMLNDPLAESIAKKKALFENQFAVKHNITIAGDASLESGKTIEIILPPATDATTVDTHRDAMMSGKYLITDITHSFSIDGTYNCTLSIKKDSVDRNAMMGNYR